MIPYNSKHIIIVLYFIGIHNILIILITNKYNIINAHYLYFISILIISINHPISGANRIYYINVDTVIC